MPLCKKCQNYFLNQLNVTGNRCSVCGKTLISEKELCLQCREQKVLSCCDICLPLFSYRLWNKKMLFDWKIGGKRCLSPFYAELVYRGILLLFPGVAVKDLPVIVPVPPRKGKIRKKGWDQIDEICHFLRFKYGLKILKGLERISGVQQKKLDRNQRLEGKGHNYIAGKGLLKAKNEKKLPSRVIIIDDVITTGVTIESCAQVLKSEGCTKVFALSLFIVD